MVHEDGTIVADELYPVAEACGQTTEQVRSCLRRLVAEGLFTRDGTGRATTYRATKSGLSQIGVGMERARLAYVQDAAGRGWDRHWHLVAFAVPERTRASRDGFRDRLLQLGGAAVQSALYVSPHPWDKDVRAAAEEFGIADSVTLASTDDLDIGGEHDPREIARRLWPIEKLADRYSRLVDDYTAVVETLEATRSRREHLDESMFLIGALRTAVSFVKVFNVDPLLPPELLPRPWPGRTARDLLLRSRRLGLALRSGGARLTLFRGFDDVLNAIP
ncbi:MAG: phenylacetic acid degradation operon negative regulatory protein [Actinomycetota bacterium]|jgi:phenylacetic acid degradation operon negative regulatory protein